jgi:hypothetical protein
VPFKSDISVKAEPQSGFDIEHENEKINKLDISQGLPSKQENYKKLIDLAAKLASMKNRIAGLQKIFVETKNSMVVSEKRPSTNRLDSSIGWVEGESKFYEHQDDKMNRLARLKESIDMLSLEYQNMMEIYKNMVESAKNRHIEQSSPLPRTREENLLPKPAPENKPIKYSNETNSLISLTLNKLEKIQSNLVNVVERRNEQASVSKARHHSSDITINKNKYYEDSSRKISALKRDPIFDYKINCNLDSAFDKANRFEVDTQYLMDHRILEHTGDTPKFQQERMANYSKNITPSKNPSKPILYKNKFIESRSMRDGYTLDESQFATRENQSTGLEDEFKFIDIPDEKYR